MLSIKIKNKYFNNNKILNNINIDIKEQEIVSIIGPSGCGKSTFLNILAKLDSDFEGKIKSSYENISFLFQDDRLLPWLTIRENLLLTSKDVTEDEINKFLTLVGLDNILDEFPKNLSGGMKKRVELVRAFINKPELILLDEAFGSLDFPTSQKIKAEFINLCNEFKPIVILVTHDLSEAILFSNKILFLSKKPTEIILEFRNPNNQYLEIKQIDKIKNEILDKYPNILEGKV